MKSKGLVTLVSKFHFGLKVDLAPCSSLHGKRQIHVNQGHLMFPLFGG